MLEAVYEQPFQILGVAALGILGGIPLAPILRLLLTIKLWAAKASGGKLVGSVGFQLAQMSICAIFVFYPVILSLLFQKIISLDCKVPGNCVEGYWEVIAYFTLPWIVGLIFLFGSRRNREIMRETETLLRR